MLCNEWNFWWNQYSLSFLLERVQYCDFSMVFSLCDNINQTKAKHSFIVSNYFGIRSHNFHLVYIKSACSVYTIRKKGNCILNGERWIVTILWLKRKVIKIQQMRAKTSNISSNRKSRWIRRMRRQIHNFIHFHRSLLLFNLPNGLFRLF